jgi:Arc/MetJ-type ribon-helix-helix transcriptional regulator
MVRTQIQLTEAQVSKIKKAAIDQGTSVAEVIRRAVENMVQSSGKMTIQERARRAMEIAGKFRSGKTNISRGHDKYLAEAYEK